jgi:hypothetical protein
MSRDTFLWIFNLQKRRRSRRRQSRSIKPESLLQITLLYPCVRQSRPYCSQMRPTSRVIHPSSCHTTDSEAVTHAHEKKRLELSRRNKSQSAARLLQGAEHPTALFSHLSLLPPNPSESQFWRCVSVVEKL